jgi:hypothetical protein
MNRTEAQKAEHARKERERRARAKVAAAVPQSSIDQELQQMREDLISDPSVKIGASVMADYQTERETKMKTVKKPATAPKSQPAKAGKTKNEVMLDMVCRKRGATEAEICEQIGWKACLVTLKRAAEKFRVSLTSEKDKTTNRNRYFGARA